MIVFEGELDKRIEKILFGNVRKLKMFSMIVTSLIFLPLVISLIVLINAWQGYLVLIPYGLFVAWPFLPHTKEEREEQIPVRIIVDIDEGTIVFQSKRGESFKMLEAVEQVVDYGDWYTFVFGGNETYFICQKSLLTEGTLEEFEQLFEGKIERRY